MLGHYYFTRTLATILPAGVFYPLGNAFIALLYCARPRVRRDLRRKISDAMPEVTDTRELDRIGRGAYAALLYVVPDFVYFRKHPERVMRELEVEGIENLERADARGLGVLVLHVHHGPAQKHAIMARIGRPYALVMWHPDNTPLPGYTMKLALEGDRLGGDPDKPVIWVGPGYDTIREVREHLAAGKRVAMAIDVAGKCKVDFFGRPAALADGLAHWALDSGATVLPVAVLRTRRPYRFRLIICEPVSYELSGDRKADVKTIMQAAAKAGESLVRLAPEQWMSWFGLWHWWSKGRELELADRSALEEAP